MRRARPPPYYAHKGPELDNMYRTQRLDSALVCAGVLRNSGRCVRNPPAEGSASDMPANESGVSAPFWPYGVTSECIIIEHLLVDDENERQLWGTRRRDPWAQAALCYAPSTRTL